ncbi:MAG TPA: metal-dependent hydrolase [Deinococcales bacterium]|nr:metal-dependent hydrolase [Deinococcales bacterium]
MKISFLGHSAVLIESGGHRVIIDPFLTGNPAAAASAAEVEADFVVITHAHGDHWGDAMALAKRGATIVSTAEIAGYAQAQGAEQARAMNIGGQARLPFGTVKFTPAWHSSSFPDGTYGGMPMGVILEVDGKRIYHAGDTALFSDMSLIGAAGLDLALLPIGDNFTMGPADALRALELLTPKAIVPIHYDTFPLIAQDGPAFVARAAEKGFTGRALRPGESLDL